MRAAWQGRDSARDVACDPDLARRARKMDPREHRRHAATAPAAKHPPARRDAGRTASEDLAGAHGAPPEKPAVLRVSPRHGSDRLPARKLRRDWPLADEGSR